MKIRISTIIFWIFFIILYLLHAVINGACDWYNMRFGVSFEEILFTITSPLVGADISFLDEAVEYTFPYILKALPLAFLLILATFIFYKIIITLNIEIRKLKIKIDLRIIYQTICFYLQFVYLRIHYYLL